MGRLHFFFQVDQLAFHGGRKTPRFLDARFENITQVGVRNGVGRTMRFSLGLTSASGSVEGPVAIVGTHFPLELVHDSKLVADRCQ